MSEKMEKLAMCRLCLVEDVRMCIVDDMNLHQLYEKLTDIPFVTEDSRPILICFFCCTKLKQCYRLLRQCLEAEKLFAQRMNEDYQPKSLTNQDHSGFLSGFVTSPIEHISIVAECQTESFAIKGELTAVCEILDNSIEPMEEHQSEELKLESFNNTCLDVADIPPHHSELDSEDDAPLMEFKTEVEEEQEVPKKKQTARETKKLKLENLNNTDVADILPHHSESDSEDHVPLMELKTELEEEQDVPKKKQTARETKRGYRRIKLKGAKIAQKTNKEKSNLKVIRTTQKRTSKRKCNVCRRSFSENSALKTHLRIHTGEKPYKCEVCQRSFNQKIHLTNHNRIHTGVKPFKCDICQCSFSHKWNLTNHIRIHTGEKPYKCDICQSSFSEKGNLVKHIRIHTGEKPYKCDLCQRRFHQNINFKNHICVRNSVKPLMYQCSFNQECNITDHILIDPDEKPYKCDVCQRSFNYKSHLTEHIRIHTGEKLFKCDVCQRSFIKKDHFSRHMRIHTGEKPYKCDICQRRFNQKSHLTHHIRIHTR